MLIRDARLEYAVFDVEAWETPGAGAANRRKSGTAGCMRGGNRLPDVPDRRTVLRQLRVAAGIGLAFLYLQLSIRSASEGKKSGGRETVRRRKGGGVEGEAT